MFFETATHYVARLVELVILLPLPPKYSSWEASLTYTVVRLSQIASPYAKTHGLSNCMEPYILNCDAGFYKTGDKLSPDALTPFCLNYVEISNPSRISEVAVSHTHVPYTNDLLVVCTHFWLDYSTA